MTLFIDFLNVLLRVLPAGEQMLAKRGCLLFQSSTVLDIDVWRSTTIWVQYRYSYDEACVVVRRLERIRSNGFSFWLI
jgi:hypothetical protein